MATLKLLSPPAEWNGLGQGFRVVAHIVRWHGEGLLTVPIGALFRMGSDWATFVVREGKAEATRIGIGERNADVAEVVSGLKEGDEVILHPADTIASGTAVVIAEAAAAP